MARVGDDTALKVDTVRGHSFTDSQIAGQARVHFGDSYSSATIAPSWSLVIVLLVGIALALGGKHVQSLLSQSADAPFLVPFARNPDFIPSGNITQRLQQLESTNEHSRMALYGIGGVGKTSIAVEYAYLFRQRNRNVAVFWLYAGTAERLESELIQLAYRLGVSIPDNSKDGTDGVIDTVLNHLADERNGPWLLVIDNADLANLITPQDVLVWKRSILYRIPQTRKSKVLMATSSRRVAEAITGRWNRPVQVEVMNAQDAELLLRSRVPSELLQWSGIHQSHPSELVEALNYLPLAIIQAAAYMQYYRVDVSGYFSAQHHDQGSLLGHEFDLSFGTRDRDQPNAVLANMYLTLTGLRESSPLSAWLLEVMTHFSPEAIPTLLLLEVVTEYLDGPTTRYSSVLREIIAPLLALSIITEDEPFQQDDDNDVPNDIKAYSIHPVVGMVLRILLDKNVRKATSSHWISGDVLRSKNDTGNSSNFPDAQKTAVASILRAWPYSYYPWDQYRKEGLVRHAEAAMSSCGYGMDAVELELLVGCHIVDHYLLGEPSKVHSGFAASPSQAGELAWHRFVAPLDILEPYGPADVERDEMYLIAHWGEFLTWWRHPDWVDKGREDYDSLAKGRIRREELSGEYHLVTFKRTLAWPYCTRAHKWSGRDWLQGCISGVHECVNQLTRYFAKEPDLSYWPGNIPKRLRTMVSAAVDVIVSFPCDPPNGDMPDGETCEELPDILFRGPFRFTPFSRPLTAREEYGRETTEDRSIYNSARLRNIPYWNARRGLLTVAVWFGPPISGTIFETYAKYDFELCLHMIKECDPEMRADGQERKHRQAEKCDLPTSLELLTGRRLRY